MSNIVKEFESRIMLDESEYIAIVSHYIRLYPHNKFLKNTNYYLDTDELYLRHNHTNLRVRIINDVKYELTLKIKHPDGDDEINDIIVKKDADALINGEYFPEGAVKKYLETLPYPLNAYKTITSLNTLRLEIQNEDHLLVLDKNTYSDITDYNLEIEVNDSINTANRLLNEYVKQFNLANHDKKYIGKSHRAIKAATKKA